MNILTKLMLLFVALLFVSASPSGTSFNPSGTKSTKTGVRGSAWATQDDGMTFHTTLNVFQQNGMLKGEIKMQLDLSPYGLGIVNFTGKPTCLRFDGDTHVYVGAIVNSTNRFDVVPTGIPFVIHVRDLPDGDITNGDIGITCDSSPILQETPVTSGDFVIF